MNSAARELRAGRAEQREGWFKPAAGWNTHFVRSSGWSACGQVMVAPEVELAPDDGRTLVGDCARCHDELDRLTGRRKRHGRAA